MQEPKAIVFSDKPVPKAISHNLPRAKWHTRLLGAMLIASSLSAAHAKENAPAEPEKVVDITAVQAARSRPHGASDMEDFGMCMLALGAAASVLGPFFYFAHKAAERNRVLGQWNNVQWRVTLKRDTERVVSPEEAQKKKYRTALVACKDDKAARAVWDRLEAKGIIPMRVRKLSEAKLLIKNAKGMDLIVTDMQELGKHAKERGIDFIIADGPSRTMSFSLHSPDMCPGLSEGLLEGMGKAFPPDPNSGSLGWKGLGL